MPQFIWICLTSAILTSSIYASDWSITELHYQRGKLKNPFRKTKTTTQIYTLQHASGWKYGSHFFFLDFIDDNQVDGFGDSDIHGEAYTTFSLSKTLKKKTMTSDALKDMGLTLGFDFSSDSNIKKIILGPRLDWKVKGFTYFNTLIAFYSDQSGGLASGGAPSEDDSYIIDLAYLYPLQIKNEKFYITGHIEWIGGRDTEAGTRKSDWILSQAQFRYDLGYRIWKKPLTLFAGIEWQYWKNKLGVKDEDENALQALVVWRLHH